MDQVAPPADTDAITAARLDRASDPQVSAWVAANAGSGKTYVLARRVVRLLLGGADPARILCLTFTKAAAAEMAKRVFANLSEWVRLDDDRLRVALADLTGRAPDAALMARARRLFARALETPGGLKIQTVHAFCERLLHQFPFEANVAGHFEVLEENAAEALVAEARRAVLARAARDLDGPLGEALRIVVLAASDRGHEAAIAELIEKRGAFRGWIVGADMLDQGIAELGAALGLHPGDDPETLTARIVGEAALDAAAVAGLVDALDGSGGVNDGRAADRLRPYLTAADDIARGEAYRGFFCKENGELRSVRTLVSKAVRDGWPGLEEILLAEAGRLEALFEAIAAAECHRVSAALIRLADAVLTDYDRRKRRQGFLDFDDLVARTVALLARSDAARWVHYKIDQGLDHILLDEAQDTSPAQWDVVKLLADDFFTGQDAADGRSRTLFAVGDEKQSIYSFQGAVPRWFTSVKGEMKVKAEGALQELVDVHLHVSRRSTPDILLAVDRIFAPAHVREGVVSEAESFPPHEAYRRNERGKVVIWPMEPAPPEPEPGDWAEPLDHIGSGAPEVVLARRIAGTIRGWLDPADPERLESSGRPIRPGEILILARKRGALSEAINRELKRAGIPVAGADRLALAGHIAVLDLLALGDVVLQDRDDLSLAAILRSPLFGLDEDALYAVAHDRGYDTLWRALEAVADAEPFESAVRELKALRERADFVGPFAFYAEILGGRGGRRRFAARLGGEVEDVLDEFLAQALVYERFETPSLQGFIAWMRAAATEIRRETDTLRDEVRVMTVHGAKGLEADVVFLVDDGSAPAHASHDPQILAMTDDPDAAVAVPLVWARGVRRVPAAVEKIREANRVRSKQEYRRLLYVGLTRARDRLYVCGTDKERTSDAEMRWHALVTAALAGDAVPARAVDGTEILEWRAPGERPVAAPAVAGSIARPEPIVPEWLSQRAAAVRSPRQLRPSAALGEESVFGGRVALEARLSGGGEALARGRIVHRLLEALPEQPEDGRAAVAERYLAAVAAHWPPDRRTALAAEIAAILAHPDFAPVFAPGSRAEVEIAGRVATARGEEALSGRIDRLAVTDRRVLIVDYKTNRPAPGRLEDVPEAYVAQLALYRHVLARLYPGRRVVAALLWTEVPSLMEIPDAMLDAMETRLRAG